MPKSDSNSQQQQINESFTAQASAPIDAGMDSRVQSIGAIAGQNQHVVVQQYAPGITGGDLAALEVAQAAQYSDLASQGFAALSQLAQQQQSMAQQIAGLLGQSQDTVGTIAESSHVTQAQALLKEAAAPLTLVLIVGVAASVWGGRG